MAIMGFPQRLTTLRKERGLTQQIADIAGINVVQIRRYETAVTLPTFEVLKKLAVALSITADALLFDNGERGPDDDLRLEFEAVSRLDPDEKNAIKTLIQSVVIKHDVKRVGGFAAGT